MSAPPKRPAAKRAPAAPRAFLQLWKNEPEDHDYPAAEDYLSLVLAPEIAEETVKRLRKAPLVQRKAKDILRASRLDLLAETNLHVAGDLRKIRAGKKLSPVLLVRGDARIGTPLLIADGYHRVCASFHVDENTDIPCRLGNIAKPARGKGRGRAK